MQNVILNTDQREAKGAILRRVRKGKAHTSLLGNAGTGKTYMTADLATDLQKEAPVYACAPTHKAAWVLDEKIPVEVNTIHSFLGLRLIPDKSATSSGGYKLAPKKGAEVPERGIVVLDESSMMGAYLWRHVQKHSNLQWVFVGDPAQLPPVMQKPSPALEAPGGKLKNVVRQEQGNPILDLATRVREGKPYLDAAKYNGGKGDVAGVAITSSLQAFTESAVRGFQACDPNEPPTARMLAYTNRKVKGYNERLRTLLHGQKKLPQFVPGDWLMMGGTYTEKKEVVAQNAEELKVLKADTAEAWCVGRRWQVWELLVQRPQSAKAASSNSRQNQIVLPVLHRSEETAYEQKLAKLLSKAKKDRSRWKDYFRLKERFAEVSYCYAMTVHRSQGSTFHTAYVDHINLRKCNGRERQALIYVAATRPSERLALLV